MKILQNITTVRERQIKIVAFDVLCFLLLLLKKIKFSFFFWFEDNKFLFTNLPEGRTEAVDLRVSTFCF